MPARSALAPLLLTAVFAAAVAGCGKADLSTPKAAAKAFAAAMKSGDAETAKAASTGGDAKFIEAMAVGMGNFKKLREAAVARYGDEGKSMGGAAGDDTDLEKMVDDSTEQVAGDTATLTRKTGKPMKLKKVDGVWKVDAADMAGPGAAMGATMMERMGKAAKETADEITAGQHKTAAEAKIAFGKKSLLGG
jgi:hypothetical protein